MSLLLCFYWTWLIKIVSICIFFGEQTGTNNLTCFEVLKKEVFIHKTMICNRNWNHRKYWSQKDQFSEISCAVKSGFLGINIRSLRIVIINKITQVHKFSYHFYSITYGFLTIFSLKLYVYLRFSSHLK